MIKGSNPRAVVTVVMITGLNFERQPAMTASRRAVPFFRTHTQIPFQDLILEIFRMGGFIK